MATVRTSNSKLIVDIKGWDQVWALKRRPEISLDHITDVRAATNEVPRGVRIPGTHVPAVIAAGSFYNMGKRVFWVVHDSENAIAIDLHDENFSILVLEVADPGGDDLRDEASSCTHQRLIKNIQRTAGNRGLLLSMKFHPLPAAMRLIRFSRRSAFGLESMSRRFPPAPFPSAVADLTLVRHMKRIVLVVLLTASAAVVSRAGDTSADEREIVRLEHALIEAWQKNDVATLNAIVADDFQFWSFKGERRNRADMLKLVARSQNSGDTDTQTAIEDPVVRVYGDAAIFTGRIIDTGKHADGKSFVGKTADIHVYIRRSGRWVLVAEQETLLPIQ